MSKFSLIALLESVLNKSKTTSNNNIAFNCPFCHHNKKKIDFTKNKIFGTIAEASAASTAFPPRRIMSKPACEASGCEHATTFFPSTASRLDGYGSDQSIMKHHQSSRHK